jgi:hypothetical protein
MKRRSPSRKAPAEEVVALRKQRAYVREYLRWLRHRYAVGFVFSSL